MILSKRSVNLILITIFIFFAGTMLIPAYLPQYLVYLDTPKPIIQLIFSIHLSTLFIFPYFLGKISDKIQNRYYFILFGAIGLVFCLFLLSLTRNLILITILLIAVGFFAASFFMIFTLYAELVQDDARKISHYNAANAAGWFIGVQSGGIFIDIFGIKNILLFSFIITLICVVVIIFIKEERQLILEQYRKAHVTNFKENFEDNIEVKNKNFKSIFSSIFFRSFGMQPIVIIIVIIMSFHITSQTSIGFLVGLNPLMQFILMILIGKIVTNKNIKTLIVIGYALTIIVIFGYIFSSNFWSFLIFQILISLSYSLFWSATLVYITQNSSPKNKGRYMGYCNTSIFAGNSIGGLFFSLLLVVFYSDYYSAMYFMIIFPIIAIIIITLKFNPNQKIIPSAKKGRDSELLH